MSTHLLPSRRSAKIISSSSALNRTAAARSSGYLLLLPLLARTLPLLLAARSLLQLAARASPVRMKRA